MLLFAIVLSALQAAPVKSLRGAAGPEAISFTRIHAGDSKGAVYGFAIADLDGDGWVDIAVARSEAPNLVLFGGRNP